MFKLCTKFERNRAIRGGVIAISVFDLMTLNLCHVLRSTMINFRQSWTRWSYPLLTYGVFAEDTSCHVVTLTFDTEQV